MEGMVKTPLIENKPVNVSAQKDTDIPLMFDNIPLDLIYHYDIDLRLMSERTKRQLNDIMRLSEGETFDEKMNTIRSIEMKLGIPGNSETRYGRVWNWLRTTQHVKRSLINGK